MPETTCSRCNAWYNSERDLRDHLRAAHRKFDSEQRAVEHNDNHVAVLAALVKEPAKQPLRASPPPPAPGIAS
jgi:hypothetical protein